MWHKKFSGDRSATKHFGCDHLHMPAWLASAVAHLAVPQLPAEVDFVQMVAGHAAVHGPVCPVKAATQCAHTQMACCDVHVAQGCFPDYVAGAAFSAKKSVTTDQLCLCLES